MFNFHDNYIQKKYKDRVELLFTDTDSLLYQIHTDDFYKDIFYDIKTKFDTSDYPPNHPSGILTGVNKKVIGMFKDAVAGRQITHFVGLRPKLYSFKVEDGSLTKKCKGIKKNVVKKGIEYCRKRMISIFYLIKKLLEEMGNEKYKLVYLKISNQTLENYEKWWDSYKSLNHSFVKAPVNNSS